jgi:hypothetical protein
LQENTYKFVGSTSPKLSEQDQKWDMDSVSSCSDDSDCIILVNKDERPKVETADVEKCENSERVEDPSIKITDCPPVSISVIEV